MSASYRCLGAALVALVATSLPARADKEATAPSSGRPILTLHLYEEDAPNAPISDILSALHESFAKSDRVTFVDLPDLLDPPAAAKDALAAADAALKEAAAAFEQMDLENARAKAEGAIKTYERYLPRIGGEPNGLRRIRDAWIRLSSVRFFDGNNDGARDALRHALVYDPKIDYTPKLFPPQMKKAVIETRLMFDALGSGKLTVSSEPPGALVFVNGSARGTSPCTVIDASPGPNYVTVVKRGFAPSGSVVEIAGGGDESRSDVSLARYDNDAVVPLGQARELLGAPEAPPQLLDAAKRLGAPLVATVRLQPAGDSLTLTGYLYDTRPKHLLRKVSKTVPPAKAGEAARALAGALLDGARLDGVYAAEEAPKGPSIFARLSQSWGEFRLSKAFWPTLAVIAGVVVVGAAIGIGVAASNRFSAAEAVILFGGAGRPALAVPIF